MIKMKDRPEFFDVLVFGMLKNLWQAEYSDLSYNEFLDFYFQKNYDEFCQYKAK